MVQRSGIYPDSKTFVDMHMLADPDTVLREFDVQLRDRDAATEEIQKFLQQYFDGPGGELEIYVPSDWSEKWVIIDYELMAEN
jgi:alpha,alpha-trehalase